MLYTEDHSTRHYVRFSQIGSHIHLHMHIYVYTHTLCVIGNTDQVVKFQIYQVQEISTLPTLTCSVVDFVV